MLKHKSTLLLFILFCTFLISCGLDKAELPEGYDKDFESWHAERMEELTGNRGWLSLVGLHWLKPGGNAFGSDSANSIVLPDAFPSTSGSYLVGNNEVVFLPLDSGVQADASAIMSEVVVVDDAEANPTNFSYSHFEWVIINRNAKYGLRIWDTLLYNTHILDIERFPVSGEYIVDAEVIEYQQSVIIDNEVGMKIEMNVPVVLKFTWAGTKYEVQAFEGDKDSWFLIFSDETSGEETYGSGRYLYVDKPIRGTTTRIDFNRAYNPPCAFTDYATCLFPPEENHLDFKLLAGEKYK